MSVINQDDDLLSAAGKLIALTGAFAFGATAIADIEYFALLGFVDKDASRYATMLTVIILLALPLWKMFGIASVFYALAGGFFATAVVLWDDGKSLNTVVRHDLMAGLVMYLGGTILQFELKLKRPP